ncbi:MAG: UDP-N-acetylmuramoyl-tripeptide--D-alanyl-D-alanine ligase [Bdellovibrionota bacterium]|nr:MAG: UDP-N-acetylmuramoyl-tripeptide--D-alanyl-D-alanine ligase [Bdellovibrionota bacterium]
MGVSASKAELVRLLGAECVTGDEKVSCNGAVFDSRDVRGGELFVALKGAAQHGHAFLPLAHARGASLLLVEDRTFLTAGPDPQRTLVVPDTLAAFWKLAAWWRESTAVRTIAVTGSVGKTTTKELLASILMRHSLGTYSLKSHNNHTGVPYTLTRIVKGHRWAVLEMGMNHAGELRALTAIGKPDVAVITKIAPAHIEYFGSLDRIADAKCEILEGLTAHGVAVLNADDETLMRAVHRNFPQPAFRIATFGKAMSSDCRIIEVVSHSLHGFEVTLSLDREERTFKVPFPGAHNAFNVAAAVLAARRAFAELPLADMEAALRTARPPDMRLTVKQLTEGRRVVDDSYNASPVTMSATLGIARELKGQGLRVGLLFGDMLELGADAERFHAELGGEIAALGPEFLIYVGSQADTVLKSCAHAGVPAVCAESPEAAAHLAVKRPFDVLVVKASRGVGLDRAVTVLEECYGAPLSMPVEEAAEDDMLDEALQGRKRKPQS